MTETQQRLENEWQEWKRSYFRGWLKWWMSWGEAEELLELRKEEL